MTTIADVWMEQGMQKGMQKGSKQSLIDVAIRMLINHYSISAIQKMTQLSKSEILEIRQKNNSQPH